VPPRRESPAVLLGLLERLETIEKLGFADWPPLIDVHPAARRLLTSWGYHYDAWNLRRFRPPKRYAVLVCFLQAALAETTDAVVECQDKLITAVHSKAKRVVTSCCAPARKPSGERSKCSEWWVSWCSTTRFPTCSSATKSSGEFPVRRWQRSSMGAINCVPVTMALISA
jgi:hypothetical protein